MKTEYIDAVVRNLLLKHDFALVSNRGAPENVRIFSTPIALALCAEQAHCDHIAMVSEDKACEIATCASNAGIKFPVIVRRVMKHSTIGAANILLQIIDAPKVHYTYRKIFESLREHNDMKLMDMDRSLVLRDYAHEQRTFHIDNNNVPLEMDLGIRSAEILSLEVETHPTLDELTVYVRYKHD